MSSAMDLIAHFQCFLIIVVLSQGRRASLGSALAPGYSSPRCWRSGGCTSNLNSRSATELWPDLCDVGCH